MTLNLQGKYALVTGGSHGIGKSIAQALASEKCNVAVCARTKENLKKTVDELTSHYGITSIGIECDVLKDIDLQRLKRTIDRTWGKLDILINNAGGGGRWGEDIFENTKSTVWKEVYKKNAEAAQNLTMWAIPYMRKQKWGRVVTIASIYGKEAGGRPWFNMSKAAQISLMKTLASTPYLVRDGITFNTIAPGSIMIAGTGWANEQKKNSKKFKEFVNRELPLGRLGTPEEVANVALFLCSEKASLVNGACVSVDGGESKSF